MYLDVEMAKISDQLQVAKLDYDTVVREKYLLEERKNSLVKLLSETTKRSQLLTTHLRK